jgi:heme-degrading monooxygenase HmoA
LEDGQVAAWCHPPCGPADGLLPESRSRRRRCLRRLPSFAQRFRISRYILTATEKLTPQPKEVIMHAKILIKRKFIKGKKKEIIALLKELRSGALQQPGYISGQTLVSYDEPQTLMVIGTWQDIESWHNWQENDTRKTLEMMLESYQEGSSEYQEFILGGFIED